jgi:protein-tyrosine phosphatase
MIDFHSHILPGIDDGSRSVRQSLDMMQMELSQSVTEVVATPHFYADRNSVDRFLRGREESFCSLMNEIGAKGMEAPKFYKGAEVYYFGGIGKAEEISKLCIEGTNVLLLEMPFCQWTKDMLSDVKYLLEKQQLRIMLAHIERYYDFQKKRDIWNEILELPIYIQMNAGAFLDWKRRRKCLNILKEDLNIVLGTDCHNTESRKPNLADGRELIEKKLGQERIARIDELGERILL